MLDKIFGSNKEQKRYYRDLRRQDARLDKERRTAVAQIRQAFDNPQTEQNYQAQGRALYERYRQDIDNKYAEADRRRRLYYGRRGNLEGSDDIYARQMNEAHARLAEQRAKNRSREHVAGLRGSDQSRKQALIQAAISSGMPSVTAATALSDAAAARENRTPSILENIVPDLFSFIGAESNAYHDTRGYDQGVRSAGEYLRT